MDHIKARMTDYNPALSANMADYIHPIAVEYLGTGPLHRESKAAQKLD